jgi:AGZA family xanthine/uracil permease-like MFS transporter
MMRQITLINWKYIGDALPAFITFIIMPLTYSVAYGLIAYVITKSGFIFGANVSSGLMTYFVINTLIWLMRVVSGGRLEAADREMAEPWTWNPQGGTPPWFVRAVKNHGRFWETPEKIESQNGNEENSSEGGK